MSRLYNYRGRVEKADGPCKGCQDRHVGCHSTCLKYIDWKQERQVLLDKKRAESKVNEAVLDITYKTHQTIQRQKHIRKK